MSLSNRALIDEKGHRSSAMNVFTCTYISLPLIFQYYRFTVRDAEGKPGSGVLDGHTSWIGSFDECRRVVASAKYNETVNGVTTLKERKFNAKYCRSYWFPEDEPVVS